MKKKDSLFISGLFFYAIFILYLSIIRKPTTTYLMVGSYKLKIEEKKVNEYIINGKKFSKIERIEYLKKMSSNIRDEIIKYNLLPDEIDTFVEFLKTDLKYFFNY